MKILREIGGGAADAVTGRQWLLFSLALGLGIVVAVTGLWNFLEPLTGIATLILAGGTWWQTKRAREVTFAADSNHDSSWVVALQVGRPVAELVNSQFGHIDVLVDSSQLIGGHSLVEGEHYKQLAQAVYAACAQAQNCQIELVLSGPVGLCCLVGQCIGLTNFRVRVWQFINGEYVELPRPTPDWLMHR